MEKVVVRRCETYDKDFIKSMIREGMEELGFKPTGKAIIKPNTVYAHKRYATISPHGRKALNLLKA